MIARSPLLHRLDARDRALFVRWVLDELAPARTTRAWRLLTHVGGLRASVLAVLLPYFVGAPATRAAATTAGLALLVSHLLVQLVKRRVLRERPSLAVVVPTHVEIPDRFSFPSGHSCAAMSVAFAYAMAMPTLAGPLVLAATLVGFSRVRLGVHYPGDVLVGQALAIVSVLALRGLGA